jgi:N-hydroxyarylamine O-acetyltransferase
MNVSAYLDRIHYTQHLKPDVETLHGLHLAHMCSVPFENLDIGLKRPIKIDEVSIWQKIVSQRRGGFCYELNGLFAWLLRHAGFDVTCLNARVFNRAGELGIDFDHLALLVKIPSQPTPWLADVGFGDSFNEPLSFEEKENRSRVCGHIAWRTLLRDISPGRETMMAPGSGFISLIFSLTNFPKNMSPRACITRHLLIQASRAAASSAGLHPMAESRWKMAG